MDLTFQVPMQYCSLQHWTLLLSPVTSTTGYSFCFGSIPSFFLELFLHWSPGSIGHLPTWGVPLSVSYHFAFSYCSMGFFHGVLKARILKWFPIPFSSGPCFIRALHHDPSVLGGPTCMTHSFIELDRVVIHVISFLNFLWLWLSFCVPLMDEDKRLVKLPGGRDWLWVKLGLAVLWWAGSCSVNL